MSRKLKKELKRIISKGSFKDPFCCLQALSIILFGVLIFVSPLVLKQLNNSSFSNLILASVSSGFEKDDLFAEQNNAAKPESPDMGFIQNSSLMGISSPLTVSPQILGSLASEVNDASLENRKEIIEYIVGRGDTLSSIAEKFGISLNTVLWANDLTANSKVKAGKELIILPVSGVIHHVVKGDTVEEIAKKYKAKTADITSFNELSGEGDIYIGDILIVPNGVMPKKPPASPVYAPLATSYFICPISAPCRVTQGLHWYNAVDFSHGKCGEPIYAAAAGTVIKTKFGYNNGAGNYLTILHPNGVITSYGHLNTILVAPGQQVSQGQIIALMGGQPGTPGAGKSTGCHIHFGVYGARNPFAK